MIARKRIAVLLLCAASVLWATTAARASASPSSWFTCTPFATRLIDGLEMHNDHFLGAPGRSCITARGNQITIDTSYQPEGGSVVAYDAIEFGAYPYSRDLGLGLPAPVGGPMPVLHVSASGGPGTYLYDADLWLSRTSESGPLHHIREIII